MARFPSTHTKPGGVSVRAGQSVTRGLQIGAIGSSGDATEPQLHFQVSNGPDRLRCAGIPARFEPSRKLPGDPPPAPQTGDFVSWPE